MSGSGYIRPSALVPELLDSGHGTENLPGEVAWQSADGLSCLFFGDALELMKSMPDDCVDCIWTDPPYLLSNDGFTCVAGKRVKVNKGEWDRSLGIDIDHERNRDWLSECYRILKPAGTIWVTGTLHVYLSVGFAMLQLGFRILNDITWEKPNPPPNLGCRCFTHSTETLLWATKAKKGSKDRYTFNYDVMRHENGGKQMKTVWQFTAAGRDEKTFGKHPTQKPVALIRRCLRASTNPGDLVFDPFTGSGSTGVASVSLNRAFIGCEREPEFVDITRRRLMDTQVQNRKSNPNPAPPIPTVSQSRQPKLLETTTLFRGQLMDRTEAIKKINALTGTNLRPLAEELGVTVWKDGKLNKGWVGHTIERFLGLALNSSRAPNFGSWELKVVSLKTLKSGDLRVKETMWVTMIDPVEVTASEFTESHLYNKLQKLLVVARIFEDKQETSTLFHSATSFDLDNPEVFNQCKADYDLVRRTIQEEGFDALTGRMGVLIQPRTKGTGHGSTSRAFYARTKFVADVIGLNS